MSFKSWIDIVWEIAVVMVQSYQNKFIQTMEMRSALFYLKFVKVARSSFIVLLALLLCGIMLALGILAIPLTLIAMSNLAVETKFLSVAIFGALYLFIPTLILTKVLSQKKWLKYTRANELLEKVLKND